jgi:hypothetical protein
MDRLRDLVGMMGERCQAGFGSFRRTGIGRLVGKKRDDDDWAPMASVLNKSPNRLQL